MSKKISFRLMIAILIISQSACAVAQHNEGGFKEIFDGKTLAGWEGDPNYWRVENGNLVGEVTPATLLKTNSFIIWRGGNPANFELTLEYKITNDGNSKSSQKPGSTFLATCAATGNVTLSICHTLRHWIVKYSIFFQEYRYCSWKNKFVC